MSTSNVIGEVESVNFAIYLSKKASEKKINSNITKLQKWLYICYGLFLAAENRPLLNERPKAWDYGPVFPRVYKKQKKHDNLKELYDEINPKYFIKYDEIINVTLEHFGSWTVEELCAWTHEPGKAWDKQFNNRKKYDPMENLDIYLDFEGFVINE